MLDITVPLHSDDFNLFRRIVNIGIDAWLEGFTESRFYREGNRFCLDFNDNEVSILLRRLDEKDTEHADMWVRDIVYCYYGYETYV